MITAGIDAGLRTTKVVILDDEKVIARGRELSGGANRDKAIEKAWNDALAAAGLKAADVSKVAATGQGKRDVYLADEDVVESVADARAARFLYPAATSVVDLGADQTRVVTLGEGNEITEVVQNQKCMAGLGLLLEVIANRLDLTLEEISSLGPDAGDILVNDGCPVFAEQGALELLNRGASKEDVAGAVTDVVVLRLNSILNDKVRPAKETTVLIGGLTKNTAVVDRLKKRSGIDFLMTEEGEYAGALGAALIAAEQPVL
jgi:predicted CoA-substrate-specific enzyme activase